jgi:hypothetical protein
MDYKTENYQFDDDSIIGWEEIREYEIEVRNTRDIPVKVEIKRNFPTRFWKLTTDDQYEEYNLDTIKYTLEMEPESKQVLNYTLRTYHGIREGYAPRRLD